jgi:hypothetical protein
MLPEVAVARILWGWLFIIFILLSTNTERTHFGPNDTLIIFETTINTKEKYAGIVVLSICNSAIRAMNTNVLYPWIINNIQDTKTDQKVNEFNAYEITAVHSIYCFVDWYIYMNILLSQIDLFMIEVVVDLIVALFTTRYYLQRDYTLLCQEDK